MAKNNSERANFKDIRHDSALGSRNAYVNTRLHSDVKYGDPLLKVQCSNIPMFSKFYFQFNRKLSANLMNTEMVKSLSCK